VPLPVGRVLLPVVRYRCLCEGTAACGRVPLPVEGCRCLSKRCRCLWGCRCAVVGVIFVPASAVHALCISAVGFSFVRVWVLFWFQLP
jgi:hypothetical protein